MNNYGQTLYHHGVKGQKWGLRKYQNEDGSLTAAGREHYGYGTESSRSKYKQAKKDYKAAKKAYGKAFDDAFDYETRHPISTMTNKAKRAEANRRWDDAEAKEKVKDSAKEAYKQAKQEYKNSDEYKARQEKIKKAAIAGAAMAAGALAVYGAYKINQKNNAEETKRLDSLIDNGKKISAYYAKKSRVAAEASEARRRQADIYIRGARKEAKRETRVLPDGRYYRENVNRLFDKGNAKLHESNNLTNIALDAARKYRTVTTNTDALNFRRTLRSQYGLTGGSYYKKKK